MAGRTRTEPVKVPTGYRFRPCCTCGVGSLLDRHGHVVARDITRSEAEDIVSEVISTHRAS